MIKFTKTLMFISCLLIQFCFLYAAPTADATEIKFKPQISIGDYKAETEGGQEGGYAVSNSTETIGNYIRQIYNYAVGIVGIVAVVVMMFGGITWMTSMGNPSRVTEAKAWIASALTGLLLVSFSYVILRTVNPDLVNFKSITIPKAKLVEVKIQDPNTGCCDGITGATPCAIVNKEDCTGTFYGSMYKCNSSDKCEVTSNKCNLDHGICTNSCPTNYIRYEGDSRNTACAPEFSYCCFEQRNVSGQKECTSIYGACYNVDASIANNENAAKAYCQNDTGAADNHKIYDSNAFCPEFTGQSSICCRLGAENDLCGDFISDQQCKTKEPCVGSSLVQCCPAGWSRMLTGANCSPGFVCCEQN